MSAFHSNHIKIHCGIPYVNVEELVCKESVNEHTEMYVKLAIAQDTVHWLERNSLCEKKLNIKIGQQDMESVDYWGDSLKCINWDELEGSILEIEKNYGTSDGDVREKAKNVDEFKDTVREATNGVIE